MRPVSDLVRTRTAGRLSRGGLYCNQNLGVPKKYMKWGAGILLWRCAGWRHFRRWGSINISFMRAPTLVLREMGRMADQVGFRAGREPTAGPLRPLRQAQGRQAQHGRGRSEGGDSLSQALNVGLDKHFRRLMSGPAYPIRNRKK